MTTPERRTGLDAVADAMGKADQTSMESWRAETVLWDELAVADADYAARDTISGEEPSSPTPLRRFGQLPDLAVRDDFDDPLPEAELGTWERGVSEG